MAMINGIELKGVKQSTIGMEYPGFSASIYMDGKKIGTAIDYGDGGGMNVSIPKEVNAALFKARLLPYIKKVCKESSNPENIMLAGAEIALCDLLELTETEKLFKKQIKESGENKFMFIDLKKQLFLGETALTFYEDVGLYVTNKPTPDEMIAVLKEKGLEFDKVILYRSLEDFNVTVQAEGETA